MREHEIFFFLNYFKRRRLLNYANFTFFGLEYQILPAVWTPPHKVSMVLDSFWSSCRSYFLFDLNILTSYPQQTKPEIVQSGLEKVST